MTLEKIDFRFIEILHELYALEQYVGSVEAQLPDLIRKEEEKAYETLRKNGYENDPIERDQIHLQLDELIEEVLPRYFWSPILVTLWAIFESALFEIAKEVKSQERQPLGLNDVTGNILEKARKYFNHVLKFPIPTGGESWRHIRMLYVVRNAIAHANGRLENIRSEKDVEAIKKLASEGIGVQEINGSLLFSPEYVKMVYTEVLTFLSKLTELTKAKYPEPINW